VEQNPTLQTDPQVCQKDQICQSPFQQQILGLLQASQNFVSCISQSLLLALQDPCHKDCKPLHQVCFWGAAEQYVKKSHYILAIYLKVIIQEKGLYSSLYYHSWQQRNNYVY